MKKTMLSGIAGGLVVFVLMTLLGAGYSAPKIIRAQRFEIVAPNGQVQAILRATIHGPEISLGDVDGRERWILGVDARGPSMGFMDQYGKVRIGMAIIQGSGVIAVTDSSGQTKRIK